MDKALLNRAGIEEVLKMLSKKGFNVSHLPRSSGAHLLISRGDRLCKVTVRAKQKVEWPAVKGTSGKNHFMVLVDFEKNSAAPDFYILSNDNYKATADIRVEEVIRRAGRSTYPVARDSAGTPTWLTETVNATGEHYEGCSFRPIFVKGFQNKWETITNYFGKS